LVTPETDTTLTDNATGSNNYAAKGAHRLKIALNLVLLDTDSTADSSFVELMRLVLVQWFQKQEIQNILFLEKHLHEEHLMNLVIIL
jgi:hypothetical protein